MFTLIKKEKDEETINKRKGMTKKEMIDNHLDTLFYDVSNDALKQTVKDTYKAFIRFFKKESKFPNRKSYKDKTKSFYVDPYKIEFTDKKVKLEKIANNLKTNRQVLNYISLAEKNRIPIDAKYYNPRVVFDGDRFYIVVAVNDEYAPKKKIKEKVDEVIGIDLNVSTIVLSNNKKYKSINKEKRIKKATRKLKLLQRKSSRRYLNALNNKKKLKEAKNFIKIKKLIRKCYKRLSNLRDDYINKVIDDILYKPPKRIVIETLDIKSMQQNKKISS
jgi:putative transposase